MLDAKVFRNELERIEASMIHRGGTVDEVRKFPELDQRRRMMLQETDQLKNHRNVVSQEVAKKKKAGEDAEAQIIEMREVGERIKSLDEQIRSLEEVINSLVLSIPNIPHDSVPVGKAEEDNVEIRRWGEPREFSFEPSAHWDLGQNLGILDFEAAAKVTGSRFVFYKGLGARLERALISFMMDLHSEQHGYTEMLPPLMVNKESLVGTGQLPKFAEDLFKLADSEYFLIPTAEVPVTNYHRDEILSLDTLPKYYVAYSPCFRSEAGSAGRDTRGIIRQHQFNKVEMVKLVTPEQSYAELEALTENAETVLQLLKLPYRVLSLCTGDIGFTAAKT